MQYVALSTALGAFRSINVMSLEVEAIDALKIISKVPLLYLHMEFLKSIGTHKYNQHPSLIFNDRERCSSDLCNIIETSNKLVSNKFPEHVLTSVVHS